MRHGRNIGSWSISAHKAPTSAQLGLTWLQLRPNLAQHPSWAQVGPKLAPVQPNLKAKEGKAFPQSALVGPSRPAPFCPICWVRAVLVTKRRPHIPCPYHAHALSVRWASIIFKSCIFPEPGVKSSLGPSPDDSDSHQPHQQGRQVIARAPKTPNVC